MYYLVSGGQIVESQYGEFSQEELQEWADRYNEHVYVISGEHYGMTAEPQSTEDEGDTAAQARYEAAEFRVR